MSGNEPVKAKPMTPDQMKAARALLGWSRSQLGACSGTSAHMVRTFECAACISALNKFPEWINAVTAVRATLEAAGVEFITGDKPGVKLRKPV